MVVLIMAGITGLVVGLVTNTIHNIVIGTAMLFLSRIIYRSTPELWKR